MNAELGNPKPRGGVEATFTTFDFAGFDGVVPENLQTALGDQDFKGRLGWLDEGEHRYLVPLIEVEEAWSVHAEAPPSYVKSDDPVFAGLLSKVFGCPVQE